MVCRHISNFRPKKFTGHQPLPAFPPSDILATVVKIYHGTTEAIGRKARTEGLRPRKLTGKSNWKHIVESNPSLIYLTTAYAPYYALQTVNKGEKIAIIEIETDVLDESKFRPDEDFIEQATSLDKKNTAGIKGKTVNQRTKYIRNHIDEFSGVWKQSIQHLGNCGYKCIITSKSITKVAVVDISKCLPMCSEVLEAVITLANHSVCGPQYRMMTRWFMGEPVTVDEWFKTQSVNPLDYLESEEKASAIKKFSKMLASQDCIKII